MLCEKDRKMPNSNYELRKKAEATEVEAFLQNLFVVCSNVPTFVSKSLVSVHRDDFGVHELAVQCQYHMAVHPIEVQ